VTLVGIVKNWERPDLRRQTPGSSGHWGDCEFVLDPTEECDYLLVLNYVNAETVVRCPPENVWMLTMEPPIGFYKSMHAGAFPYARIYTQDVALSGSHYRLSHPALPWQVERNYDELTQLRQPEKTGDLSCVTSNLAALPGHRARLRFLDRLSERVNLELFGRGIRPLDDKWDGIAPFRYSLGIENFRHPYYWTEKLADCFLSWTMPIYYGAPNAAEFFPAESFLAIDIADPDTPAVIYDAVRSNLWERSLDAISEARRLVLERWQLCPFIAGEIEAVQSEGLPDPKRERIVIAGRLPASRLLRLTPLAYTRPRRALVACFSALYGYWRRLRRLARRIARR
jgi:hypothetical protein